MSVTITIDVATDPRELAAIACLIAVLRSDQPIPAPPLVSFDYSGDEEEPPVSAAAAVPPPPPAADPPASEALLQQEAARADSAIASGPGELDVNGLPWDERIHAGTKAVNADKSWRLKRGVDPALVTSVTAELKAKVTAGQPAAGASVPPPPTDAAPTGTDPAVDAATAFGAGGAGNASDTAGAPPPPAADGAAPPPPVPPAADAPATSGELTYPQIIARANEAALDYNTLNGLAVDLGLEKFASLVKRPDMLRLFMDTMEAKIAELG